MRYRNFSVSAGLGTAALALAALAGAPLTASAVEALSPASVDRELEEIVVNARKDSLSSLRLAIIAAEDRFYERWNTLNDDDALDVQCRTEAPTGSRLTRRTCAPLLLDEVSRDEALLLFSRSGLGGNMTVRSVGELQDMAAAELKRRTLPLLETDQELRLALLERAKLQQLFDDLHRVKFEHRFVVWD